MSAAPLVDCGECRTQGCPAGRCRHGTPAFAGAAGGADAAWGVLQQLQRQSNAWEQQHHATWAEQQRDRADIAEAEVAMVRERLVAAEEAADYWRDQVREMQHAIDSTLQAGLPQPGAAPEPKLMPAAAAGLASVRGLDLFWQIVSLAESMPCIAGSADPKATRLRVALRELRALLTGEDLRRFRVGDTVSTLDQLLAANRDDPALREWALSARVGDRFTDINPCLCVEAVAHG